MKNLCEHLDELTTPHKEKVLRACRNALPADAEDVMKARSEILAGLLVRGIERKDSKLWEREIGKKAINPYLPRLTFIEVLVKSSEWYLHDVAKDISIFRQVCHKVDDFEASIAPRSLRTLIRNRTDFESRVVAFVQNASRSDIDVMLHARDVFGQVQQIEPASLDRLLRCIPVRRLRTYDDDWLRHVADHFFTWDPLIRFLKGQVTLPREVDQGFRSQFEQLTYALVRILRRKWPAAFGPYSIADAVEQIIKNGLEDDAEWWPGYVYEGSFAGWLRRTIDNQLATWWRQYSRVKVGPLSPQTPAGAFTSEAAVLSLLLGWQERYLLVENFFKGPVRGRVKEVWAALLRNDERTDAVLAEILTQKLGVPVRANALPVTRRRLRQRLDVLRYVLDVVPGGAPDEPGDRSVLAYVRQRWGLAQGDVSTIRGLAALARAAQGEETLAWALFARCCVNPDGVDAAWQTVWPMLEIRDVLHGGEASDDDAMIDEARVKIGKLSKAQTVEGQAQAIAHVFQQSVQARLGRARDWLNNQQCKQERKECRQMMRAAKIEFFLVPCWYMTVLRGSTAAQAVEILRPKSNEETWIENVMDQLGGCHKGGNPDE